MISLVAFTENDASGRKAHVGNTVNDSPRVLRGKVNQERVLTHNVLKSLQGDTPPSMSSEWVLVCSQCISCLLSYPFLGWIGAIRSAQQSSNFGSDLIRDTRKRYSARLQVELGAVS